MTLRFTDFLIVCPLVFLSGFVDAIGGGGGLISLPAYLLAGLPPHLAIGTNKFSSSCGTLISTVRYCKNKCVDWGLAMKNGSRFVRIVILCVLVLLFIKVLTGQ